MLDVTGTLGKEPHFVRLCEVINDNGPKFAGRCCRKVNNVRHYIQELRKLEDRSVHLTMLQLLKQKHTDLKTVEGLPIVIQSHLLCAVVTEFNIELERVRE